MIAYCECFRQVALIYALPEYENFVHNRKEYIPVKKDIF